ncbi:MAG: GWxTD domain-containing protein [Acidobacteriota bacterium]|nr:GWxTD domain-containing protein [Acidobacteriota bacterium]
MKKQHHPPLLSLLLLIASLSFSGPVLAKEKDEKRDTSAVQKEEAEDYYQRWLNQDVTYIISDEEESVFNSLTSPEEKELFIEQFWRRRDPDLRTAINEFKEEHYRRIAYVNERFYAGVPGWKTDRGMIYILHGPPHEIESYVTGGNYNRSFSEGGGSTVVHPLEVWRYRHLEGVGDDIVLEFVDRTYTGTYKLALFPDEKDALLHFDGYGLTLSEQWGISDKQHRPSLIGGRSTAYETRLHNNNPFQRYEIFSRVMVPKKIKYKDLKELVKVEIGFSNLPFRVQSDYFKLNDGQVLVPVTVEIRNKFLSFEADGEVHSARVGLYGVVTSLTNKFIEEFDQDLVISFGPERLMRGLEGRATYQKVLLLDSGTRYKLDLIMKDLTSNNIGAVKHGIIPPSSMRQREKLSSSSMLLSNYMQELPEAPDQDQMFVLGDVKIRPSLDKSFSKKLPLGVYLHLYNFGMDQASNSPQMQVSYRISRDGEVIGEATDSRGESVQFFSDRRMVLFKRLSLRTLEPGKYRLEVEAWDQVKDVRTRIQENFQVQGS